LSSFEENKRWVTNYRKLCRQGTSGTIATSEHILSQVTNGTTLFCIRRKSIIEISRDYMEIMRLPLITKDVGIAPQDLKWAMRGTGLSGCFVGGLEYTK
jgi:hypothetical protein